MANDLYGMPARYYGGTVTLDDGQPTALRVNSNGALLVKATGPGGGGVTPVDETYTVTDLTAPRRVIDVDDTSTFDLAETVATLITDLKASGIIK